MTSKNSMFNRFLLFEFWDMTLFCGNLKKINILIFRFIAFFELQKIGWSKGSSRGFNFFTI